MHIRGCDWSLPSSTHFSLPSVSYGPDFYGDSSNPVLPSAVAISCKLKEIYLLPLIGMKIN